MYQTWTSGTTASVHLESLQGLAGMVGESTYVKTDILVEPEVKGSEQLYKEIYIVIHTAYIVYTMQLKCCCFYTRSSKHVKR